ncbi:long-chain-fatty-acid--CoA ligase [Gandjariella thermophila]|uniref:AMP-dependent synthetase n=1 Tax=Gandjariella thermophila TaxID=1931992 RepID=A0A4D4IXL6_9PSEU|nr:long-chain fatty acid--CoA ligase [Gandjariella thermophila]GDY29115.1 AMP-dependent synthetase [Gandjariella thermophila]
MTLSLACTLAESARRFPKQVAVIEGEHRVSYEELWRQARSLAAGLRELGVQPGDRVALLCPNTVDFPRAYFAILGAGAVVVPVHLLLTADEVGFVLTDSEARLLVCAAGFAEVARQAGAATGVPVATLGEEEGRGTRLEDVAAVVRPLASYEPRQAGDPAVVLYTSGTTGRPKGAVLTHLNLVMNATVNSFDANGLGRDDVVLGCLPLFHTFGQTVAMNGAFRCGVPLVLQPRFDAAAAIELMLRENVTVFLGVPTMYLALLEAAEGRAELPAPRLCISGGAALPVPVQERFHATFGVPVYEGYGLSETSPTATVNQPDLGNRPGTVGPPIWGVEVEIARPDVDDRIELLGPGEPGEIVVRGHNVFAGYLNRPEETAAVLVDGWFRTGDIGVKDAEGFVSVVDRKKDLIIRGGFNVYPREVEDTLLGHPAVGQVAVIGVPDERYGEEILAVVVPSEGAERPGAEEIVEWARERLGRHKYPRRVEFVDTLPLGPSHKVLKRELRRQFAQA